MSAGSITPMRLTSHSLVDPVPVLRGTRRAEGAAIQATTVREIVTCLDGSELGRCVIPHARIVADAFGARLTLLHVLEVDASVGNAPADPFDWGIRQREAQAYLEGVAAQIGDLGSAICTELIQGRPAEQICGWAERHHVDLTVLCSHGVRGITDWDLASTARKLIDRIPGSLLLVPAASAHDEVTRYRRILVPLDGSPRAESVVPVAQRIAEAEGAELVLAHIVSTPEITHTGPLDAEGADLERRLVAYNRRIADAYLDRLRARLCQTGVPTRALVVSDGSTRLRLEQLVLEERADLVVMSAHGHTGRSDIPCGSVTEYALSHATKPLLVVRERGRRRIRRADSPRAPDGTRVASTGAGAL